MPALPCRALISHMDYGNSRREFIRRVEAALSREALSVSDDETLSSQLSRHVRGARAPRRTRSRLSDSERRRVAKAIAAHLRRAGFDCDLVEDHDSCALH